MKYDINNDNIAKINDTYKFILLLDSFYFWNTVKLSISVNNSIGASPYSDYYTIKGAINCEFLCFSVVKPGICTSKWLMDAWFLSLCEVVK